MKNNTIEFVSLKASKEDFFNAINNALNEITMKLVSIEEMQDKLNSAVLELAQNQEQIEDSETWFDKL